jgi:site-specific DNA-methyltransferase (adenine-specific)
MHTILHGDCLEVMEGIKNNSIDMILCDLPYGTTACKWDIPIPFTLLWKQYIRIIKKHGAIVLHASQPFTSMLVMSNLSMYRHCWVWNKNNSAGFVTAKIRPFQICEDIVVFGLQKVNYYPQMEIRGKPRNKGGYTVSDNYNVIPTKSEIKSNEYYPKNLINISNAVQIGKLHPTQKPVELCEYLVKTYTQEGELVLDNCAGSGTTGVACKNLGRQFILIEKEKEYCEVISKRLQQEYIEGKDFNV